MKSLLIVAILLSGFVHSQALGAANSCKDRVQKFAKKGVSVDLLNQMAKAAGANDVSLDLDSKIYVADFSKPDTERRLFEINLKSNKVEKFLVAHGKGSGTGHKVTALSNKEGSKATPSGLFRIGPTFNSETKGKVSPVVGLEASNRKTGKRGINVESCTYVSDDYPKNTGHSMGSFCVSKKAYKKLNGQGQLEDAILYSGMSKVKAAEPSKKLCSLLGESSKSKSQSKDKSEAKAKPKSHSKSQHVQ